MNRDLKLSIHRMMTKGAVDGMHFTLWPFSRMQLCQTENEIPCCIQKFYSHDYEKHDKDTAQPTTPI